MSDDDFMSPVVGRRQILRSAAGAAGLMSLAGFGLANPLKALGAAAPAPVPKLRLPRTQNMCVLTPQETQGPYYLNLNLVRSDITENFPGLQTRLFIHVLQASTCTPVANAAVDVWHASAGGVYSGFSAQGTLGQTYLRGVQYTNANGIAAFTTVYPGWYMGRAHHIHVKVRPVPTTEVTTQLYFRDSLNTYVNGLSPYSSHGQNSTTNVVDGLFLPETLVSVLYKSSNSMYLEATIGI